MLRDAADRKRAAAGVKRTSDASDAALLGRTGAGELRAFETLYRVYHPRLARFLGLMTPRQTLVEEVLNDTMHVVWRRADSFNGRCKVSTWIFAIAYRTALKALRGQDEPVDDFGLDAVASGDAGPERQHSDREARAALEAALARLSTEQRSVLVLTYFHDLSCAEVAEIVECPVDTVKTRMFHGRRRLRALLSGDAGDWL